MKNYYDSLVCLLILFAASSAKAELVQDSRGLLYLPDDRRRRGQNYLNDKEIQTLQDAFSIVLTYNSGAGNYGGVDFTLNVLDPSIFSKGLAKFTPTGAIGMYVEPNSFFKPGSRLDFGGGATAASPVTSTLLFSNNENTWASFAEYIETDTFKIIGHLQSMNQPSIQGAMLIWEGKIERRNNPPAATSEPATLMIFGVSLAGLGFTCRRKQTNNTEQD